MDELYYYLKVMFPVSPLYFFSCLVVLLSYGLPKRVKCSRLSWHTKSGEVLRGYTPVSQLIDGSIEQQLMYNGKTINFGVQRLYFKSRFSPLALYSTMANSHILSKVQVHPL